jgi:hypothetical protein
VAIYIESFFDGEVWFFFLPSYLHCFFTVVPDTCSFGICTRRYSIPSRSTSDEMNQFDWVRPILFVPRERERVREPEDEDVRHSIRSQLLCPLLERVRHEDEYEDVRRR